jgi:hypothetical protein
MTPLLPIQLEAKPFGHASQISGRHLGKERVHAAT